MSAQLRPLLILLPLDESAPLLSVHHACEREVTMV